MTLHTNPVTLGHQIKKKVISQNIILSRLGRDLVGKNSLEIALSHCIYFLKQ